MTSLIRSVSNAAGAYLNGCLDLFLTLILSALHLWLDLWSRVRLCWSGRSRGPRTPGSPSSHSLCQELGSIWPRPQHVALLLPLREPQKGQEDNFSLKVTIPIDMRPLVHFHVLSFINMLSSLLQVSLRSLSECVSWLALSGVRHLTLHDQDGLIQDKRRELIE
jgi:hypothetical protein